MDGNKGAIKEESSNDGIHGCEELGGVKHVYGLNMNMCRLCLADGHNQLQPVYYAEDSPDEILLQKILELTTVEVTYACDFPSSICIECKGKLEEYYLFRRQCVENDKILRIKYYELKAVESYPEHDAERLQRSIGHTEQEPIREEEYVDENDDITLAIDETGEIETVEEEEVENIYQGVAEDSKLQLAAEESVEQLAEQQTIQYVGSDGTMTEYVTSEQEVHSGESPGHERHIHLERFSETGDMHPTDEHEIYYTVGTDIYAIHKTTDDSANAADYVPQAYDNQTEIECTTIEETLPDEEIYMEDETGNSMVVGSGTALTGTSLGGVITPRGQHDRPYVCRHCKTSFKYEFNYDRHMKNHAKVLYRCGKCSKTFAKYRKCQQHFMKAHSSQRYECDICFRTYSLPTRLENHVIEMHSENGIYKCDRCNETFTSYMDFKAHRNIHHSINGTNAVIAQTIIEPVLIESQPVGSSNALQTSARSSVSDGCDYEVMIDETKLQKGGGGSADEMATTMVVGGRQRRNGKPPENEVILIDDDESAGTANSVGGVSASSFGSAVVSSSGVSANGLESTSVHRQLLQQIEESEANSYGPKVHRCDNCAKTFVHLNNLKAHIYAEHDNDKPFKCKLCPISFKTKEILVMHMLIHSHQNTAS